MTIGWADSVCILIDLRLDDVRNTRQTWPEANGCPSMRVCVGMAA